MERPIVTISEGKIQGTTLEGVLGQNFLAFRGIPFAEPPVGPLRFKKSQEPSKWSGIRDASNYAGDIPMQKEYVGLGPYNVVGSEDCLYLNVYTNSIGRKRPVLFSVYGGNFCKGVANSVYHMDYFMTTNVVLVSPNYRVGPMGFLNLGHEVASGNQGLRDLILALKWVQRNIEAFGGDPDNVTIFGNSSGAYLVHLLTVIPATKGLVHKAIIQSRGAFRANHLMNNVEDTNGFLIASYLGMDSKDPEEVFKFLSEISAEKLIESNVNILSIQDLVLTRRLFEPVYDAPYTDDPVIPQSIDELLKNNADIPIIIGHTLNEDLITLMGKFDDTVTLKAYDENIEKILKIMLLIKDQKIPSELMTDIREKYLKNKPINSENVWNLVNLLTDLRLLRDHRTIELRNEYANAPTYVYCFSYLGSEPTFFQFDRGPQPLKGVAHADELFYMFYIPYTREGIDGKPLEDPRDRLTMERFVRMWYNFASTGNPTPKTDDRYITTVWKPSSKDKLHILDINDELTLKDEKDSDGWKLYDQCRDYISF